MKPELIPLLLCPTCGRDLSVASAGPSPGAASEGGALRCERGHAFPVRNGVPRFVDSDRYASNFAFEWTLHETTQQDVVLVRPAVGGAIQQSAAPRVEGGMFWFSHRTGVI